MSKPLKGAGGHYVNFNVLDGKEPDRRLQVWAESVELSTSAKPLDSVKTVSVLQLVAAVQDYVRPSGDGQGRPLERPHYQAVHSF